MTSSVHELSDNSESHKKQERPDSQTPPRAPSGPGSDTSSVYSEPMAHGLYPYPDPYYRSVFAPQAYLPHPYPGVQMQLMGMQQQVVPLQCDAVEEPVFVNAKQYHGILRRRQSRAKLEARNRAMKSKKPYMHESRHLHAINRPRGCGGRFLNAKKKNGDPKEDQEEATSDENTSEASSSLRSEKSAMAPNGRS
ncbi:Nuclear transcription factor Y subunit A-4 [Hirschfeldia incana]|nr:Nuclear transcription factor Y subunit A-4 [Hirschfeldia incana]KAJ0240055.1 Nuclear transcription factor Y subunit A-4 [Hirschfeldia incana]KAJ0240056.1 Nuclear transcription factor Y subunit A-4 [Hirschfeldia incana]